MTSKRGRSVAPRQSRREGTSFSTQTRGKLRGKLPNHVNWTAEGRVTPVKDQVNI